MSHKKLPIIFLMGPTATGKTDIAINLAQNYNCEIISVDSALIYREMNIGTSKPTKEELLVAPHRLIDILDPTESYSIANFIQDALTHIKSIQSTGKIPLLVGGTMLYFKSLLTGISNLPHTTPKIRMEIANLAQVNGWKYLHAELAKVDPVSAKRIHYNDTQRIGRALEVYKMTGKSLTELSNPPDYKFPYDVTQFIINVDDRSQLNQKIANRFHKMIKLGFIAEVERLKNRGDLHLNLSSMRCVGYRQVWEYLNSTISYDDMIEQGITATRQLAKRQMTWIRSWQYPYYRIDSNNNVNNICKNLISKLSLTL